MPSMYLDENTRRAIVGKWIVISLWALHGWATALVLAVLIKNEPSPLIGGMFSTVTFGIGATLLVLLLDRAADVILLRFGTQTTSPSKVEETTTRTITPVPPVNVERVDNVTVTSEPLESDSSGASDSLRAASGQSLAGKSKPTGRRKNRPF